MKLIPLSQNKFAIVDNSVFKIFGKYKWYARKGESSFYAQRNIRYKNGKHGILLLHRAIMNTPKNMFVDHIDGNGLNCLRSNMRNCFPSENGRNQRKQKRLTTSKFKGVSFHKSNNKWQAKIGIANKRIHLGYFNSEIEAALKYNSEAKKYHGKFAKLNNIKL